MHKVLMPLAGWGGFWAVQALFLVGSLDDIAIWSRALVSEDIAQLIQAPVK